MEHELQRQDDRPENEQSAQDLPAALETLSIPGQDPVEDHDPASHGPLRSGVVKWFNVAKGWGFITPKDGSDDVFVHQSKIRMAGFRSLGQGEEVEFSSAPGRRGQEATFVQGPDGAPCRGSSRELVSTARPRRRKCYNCLQFGHFAKACPESLQPKRCHHCGCPDHLVAECPTRPTRGPRDRESEDRPPTSS